MTTLDLAYVYSVVDYNQILYEMLMERDVQLGISHKGMPTWYEHKKFVASLPYKDWCFIRKMAAGYAPVILGAVYITDDWEIGIQILKDHQRQGYASWAIREMMARHNHMQPFRANINPRNAASIALFRKLGFKDLQLTLQLEKFEDVEGDGSGRNSGPEKGNAATGGDVQGSPA